MTTLNLHLPSYLGGERVTLETDLGENEEVVGWVDDYGTIVSSKVNVRIGDLVKTTEGSWAALIMDKSELRKMYGD